MLYYSIYSPLLQEERETDKSARIHHPRISHDFNGKIVFKSNNWVVEVFYMG